MQWINDLCIEIVEYIADALLDVFTMDLSYFRTAAPVTDDIVKIVIALGWALLLGNLVFQAIKSMTSGLGFEGEDPRLLFTRTFVFGFLLLASRQICEIGLGISATVIDMLQIPSAVSMRFPAETTFHIGASWLLVIIISFVIMWQIIKLFFEVAERYVVLALLALLSPLAFGMGGSKNTEDIFKGWCRMFASMCLMMVLSVISLKLLLSAMANFPAGIKVIPWMLLIVGIARVSRKLDNVISRIGLNPAVTGGLGRGLPGMLALAVIRNMGSSILKAAGNSAGTRHTPSGRSNGAGKAPGNPGPPPPRPAPAGGPAGSSAGTAANASSNGSTQASSKSSSTAGQSGGPSSGQQTGGAQTAPAPQQGQPAASTEPRQERGSAGTQTGGNGKGSHNTRRSSVPPATGGAKGGRSRHAAMSPVGGVSSTTWQESSSTQNNSAHTDSDLQSAAAVRAGQPELQHTTGRPDPNGTTQTASGTAGTEKTPRPVRPPVGGAPPQASAQSTRAAEGGSAASGMAETERPPRPSRRPTGTTAPRTGPAGIGHPKGASPGMAGTEKTPRASRPPVGGAPQPASGGKTTVLESRDSVSSGMAGTAAPPAGTASPNIGNVTPGMAGTAKPAANASPPTGGGSSSSGMAGTGRRSQVEVSATEREVQTPPPGAARPGVSVAPPAGKNVSRDVSGSARISHSENSASSDVTITSADERGRSPQPMGPSLGGASGLSEQTRRTQSTPDSHPPAPGMAGTAQPAAKAAPPVSGAPARSGMAGTAQPAARATPPVGGAPAGPGMAGAVQPPVRATPGLNDAAASGMAGTARRAQSAMPPVPGQTPPAGMAGTAPKPSRPGINQGARPTVQSPTVPLKSGKSSKPSRRSRRRKKRGK